MAVENADYIHQLNRDAPTGGESISEGDDHLRVIKKAVKGTFPQVTGPVTSSHTELNAVGQTATDLAALTAVVDSLGGDVNDLDTNSHGNVASCYYNPSVGSGAAGLVYKHNVTNVTAAPDGFQTKVVFQTQLDGDPGSISHFAFNITPVSATGNATMITITQTLPDYLGFIAWHLIGETWEKIPATECGFSLMVNDMDKSQ